MGEPGLPMEIDARMAGIELPWMKVEVHRSVCPLAAGKVRARQRVRIDSEVGAARYRQRSAPSLEYGDRKLPNGSGRRIDAHRIAIEILDPVAPVFDRKDTG